MNIDENMEDLEYYMGTPNILESWNHPIPSMHVFSLTMWNIDAYTHILKKFQHWTHSLILTMWVRCMTFVVVELEIPWHFKRVPTNILQMETMTFEKYEMPIMNVVANMDDLNDYVAGTSDILESWNPLIWSRHVSSITMSNFNAYMHNLKKFQCWSHSLLTMWGRCKMTFVVGELKLLWHQIELVIQ